jgi:peptidoglycan-N-acetylglucosamine deacetylase
VIRALRRAAAALLLPYVGTITRVDTASPTAAITFDDGPDPRYLPALLDLLDRFDVKATFFAIGARAARHPDLIAEIVRRGHVIGNHTYRHVSMPDEPGSARRAELRACRDALGVAGAPLFRPPFGHQTLASRLDAWWCGYDVIGWNVHVWDWLPKDPGWMTDELAGRTGPGDIILLHDAVEASPDAPVLVDREPMLSALAAFLARNDGRLRFVTIPQLLALGQPVRTRWVSRRAAAAVKRTE